MSDARNILFIMCDQLRWDYLSCYGHPHLQTPNLDWLAANGVRFDRVYVQSPVCGPSRACIYTGRYQSTLGVRHNGFPLRSDELGMGDYLHALGMRTAVIGKTDLHRHTEVVERLGIDMAAPEQTLFREVGFEPYERNSGNFPTPLLRRRGQQPRYNDYLRELGYEGENPWHTYANSGIDEDGNLQSGWFNKNARLAANIKEEHSETAYTTNRAMDFMREAGDTPWCLHLGYIKPHWPYMAPAPYHAMYGPEQMLPANRTAAERTNPHHPVYAGFLKYSGGLGFSNDEIRETVIRAYMGLVKQIDDHLGRLFAWMREQGLMENTVIVFTSDHGDYLGDHWLTDKYWFHEESVRVPLIIYDPSARADASRGTVCDELVEMIDLVPTFVEMAGGRPDRERLEGRSLLPFLRGETSADWREFVVSEEDYSPITVRHHLDLPVEDARATMLRTKRWKFILHERFRPELYDMENDPQEQNDLGEDPGYAELRLELERKLFRWLRQRKLRFTRTEEFTRMRSQPGWVEQQGIYIGYWDSPENG
ncbi:MAG: sulfatase-like hydrolase/transferase [Ardenticatenales bacterium]|nr:sulfatase-like hydrolase/transferase [Ardenticatenales bacterium]